MCDTLIAAANVTKNKFALFAKNSDRPPNEAQFLDWVPARTHGPGDILKCTYIEIPQVQQTHAVLLSRPFWMWGAEMGINQHGLAIGNEALFSKVPANRELALLGMDLLRLALERAKSAPEAVDVIADLLEEFGQGGSHIQPGHLYYHNSYLISDSRENWVLETIGKQWAARKIDPIYSISNLISLEGIWDQSSSGLKQYILDKGYARSKDKINLTKNFSDLVYTTFSDGSRRCARSRELLSQSVGEIQVQTMAAILRDHTVHQSPSQGIAGADICMHASLGPIRVSQTTGSMIASLQEGDPLVFATGTAAPCTGIFKPVWVDAPLDLGPPPGGNFDRTTIFWAHEELHREVIKNYPDRVAVYQDERDELETEFISGALALREGSLEDRRAYSETCFQKAAVIEKKWLERVLKVPEKQRLLHSLAWTGFNKMADIG